MVEISCVVHEEPPNAKVSLEDIHSLLDNVETLSDEYDYGFELTEDNYESNNTKNELILISRYYSIPTRKMNKKELAESIVQFESNPVNGERVATRFALWEALDLLRGDSFMCTHVLQ